MTQNERDFQKLLKGMKKFPQNVQKNIVNGSTRAAAAKIRAATKSAVPIDTGNLKDAIVVRKGKSQDKTKTFYRVAVLYSRDKNRQITDGKDGYYATMVEYGTIHQVAQPFMRPAFEANWRTSVTVARNYIAKRLPKEVKKMKAGR